MTGPPTAAVVTPCPQEEGDSLPPGGIGGELSIGTNGGNTDDADHCDKELPVLSEEVFPAPVVMMTP